MNELWKDIPGYDGKYQVSNIGRVRSMWRNNQHKDHIGTVTILKQTEREDGYMRVALTKNGKRKNYYVHRLVAEAFIPNPDNLPQVNHKSEVKTENYVENLEWCGSRYNSMYGTKIERWRMKKAKPVVQTTMDGEFVRMFKSEEEAERLCGYDSAYISMVCTGRRPSAYGYKFHFAIEDVVSAMDELFEQLEEDEQN